jgi:hypothetical protein
MKTGININIYFIVVAIIIVRFFVAPLYGKQKGFLVD